jgi:hypothetical protein
VETLCTARFEITLDRPITGSEGAAHAGRVIADYLKENIHWHFGESEIKILSHKPFSPKPGAGKVTLVSELKKR